MTCAVLNEERDYPLEKMLRSIAKMPESYIVAMFDCCRETSPSARGGGTTNSEEMNLVISFACAPSTGSPMKSNFAVDYFEYLRRKSHPDDGSILLPDVLNYWKGTDGSAETTCVVHRPLRLEYSNAEHTR